MTKFYLVQRTADGPGGALVVSTKAFTTLEAAERYGKDQQMELQSAMRQQVGRTGHTLLDYLVSFGVGGVGHPIMEVDVHEADLIQMSSIVRPS